MAVSRTTASSLLGYDPIEEERNRQKLWASLYAGASSPWEKVGIGIGQLAGGLFGGQNVAQSQQATLSKVAAEAAQQFSPNSAEYFKYIADNLPENMTMVAANAAALAREAETKERTALQADVKFVKENPDTLATEIQPLAARLENKAKLLYKQVGYNPESGDPVPEEVMARLEKTPEYRKIMQLSQAGQQSLIERSRKEEKAAVDLALAQSNLELKDLDFRTKELNIEKLTREINGLKNDVLASRALFTVNGLDYTKPLDKQNIPAKLKYTPGFMQSLITAQRKALEGMPQADIDAIAAESSKTPTSPGEKKPAPAKETTVKPTKDDEEALAWLRANPQHPQAQAVRATLKSKGLLK